MSEYDDLRTFLRQRALDIQAERRRERDRPSFGIVVALALTMAALILFAILA